jgi:phytol kinase
MAWPFPLNLVPWYIFPPLQESLYIVPVEIAIVFAVAYLAGWLKLEQGIKVGYTRKLFHFAVFSTAGVMMWYSGYGAVLYLGGISLIYILIACRKGSGHVLYEGIARDDDAPNRTFYVLVPFFATALGGMVSVYFFGVLAVVGFFVAGWGDAAGEPVGARFGAHGVSLPFFGNTRFSRTLEGSAAIFMVSFIATLVALWLAVDWELFKMLLVALPVAITAMFVEFFSPHGTDNFSVQVFASLACAWAASVVV